MTDPAPKLTAEKQLTLKELWDDFDEYYGCGGRTCKTRALPMTPPFASAGETPARRVSAPKLTDRERLLAVKLLFQKNVMEVKNDIGGVVGYTLSLDEEKTRELWNLISLLGV